MLNIIEQNTWNKRNCPYFTGVKEHGDRTQYNLDTDSWDTLEKLFEKDNLVLGTSCTLNEFEDNFWCIMKTSYNYRLEEHEETIIKELDKKEIESIKRLLF